MEDFEFGSFKERMDIGEMMLFAKVGKNRLIFFFFTVLKLGSYGN